MNIKKRLDIIYSFIQGSYWMTFCVAASFAAVYLRYLGYSNAALGTILAAGNTAGFLLGTWLADRIDLDHRLSASALAWPVLGIQAVSLCGLWGQTRTGAAAAILYAVYLAVMVAVNTLNLKICVDLAHREVPVNYGAARGMGSLAYVIASTALGAAVERHSPAILPAVGLVFTLLQLLGNGWIRREIRRLSARRRSAPVRENAGHSLIRFIRSQPRFSLLLVGISLLFFAHNTVSHFLINIVEHVGGDTETLGYLSAFMAFTELPVMFFFHRLRKRWSCPALLRVAYLAFILRTLSMALAPNVPCLFASQILQAFSYALYTPAIVIYVERVIPYEDSAKGQSLAYSTSTVGAVLSSLISGRLYDSLSVTATLLIAAAVCSAGAVICFACTKKTLPEHG